ncbi:MAG: sugar ABC transporter permease [Acidimicrobiia bacterium]|nr:sugar ABC transporter permease [Acidimicrobiia bacterium]
MRRQLAGYLFVSPWVVFFVGIYAFPLGFAVWMSFYDYFFAAPGATVDRPFVGFDNYTAALTDERVLESFRNVIVFLVINVPLTVVFAIALAIALNAAIPFRTFFRTAYFVPYVTASVALIGVWLFLFSSGGLISKLLGPLAPDPPFLINETLAMPTIAVYVTWKQLGFYVLLYLAALQNVSKELYEAAGIDGAGRWAQFRYVTWPGVRPATTLIVVLAIIVGSNLFTEPYLLTGGGGPNGASASPVLVLYQRGIEQGDAGYAASIGVLLVIFVAIVSLLARALTERGTK